jgi:methionyl-tRNA formyltransferase
MDYKVAVFSYDFCHKKTMGIITGLNAVGIKKVLVIGAPRVELNNKAPNVLNTSISEKIIHPRDLCGKFGYEYKVCAHNNFKDIVKFVSLAKSNIGIISGARILQKSIIDIFKYGIINYHPGPLPETSGLDSFYWMIKKNVRPGVTAHLINKKVDEGELIEEFIVPLSPKDTIEIVQSKLYLAQLTLHKKICLKISLNEPLKVKLITRPSKNNPMTLYEKSLSIENFNNWLKKYST